MKTKCTPEDFCSEFKSYSPLIITAPIKRDRFRPVATMFNFCPFCGTKLALKSELKKAGVKFEKPSDDVGYDQGPA